MKAIKARELSHFTEGQAKREAAKKAKRGAVPLLRERLEGKAWADLGGTDKDEVLKALAIAAGIVLE